MLELLRYCHLCNEVLAPKGADWPLWLDGKAVCSPCLESARKPALRPFYFGSPDHLEWIADKICNGGDYAKEASILLYGLAKEGRVLEKPAPEGAGGSTLEGGACVPETARNQSLAREAVPVSSGPPDVYQGVLIRRVRRAVKRCIEEHEAIGSCSKCLCVGLQGKINS